MNLTSAVQSFLAEYSGTVQDISISKRPNHQDPCPPGDGLLTCVTVRAEFRNRGIFGSNGPFLSEVYPRYPFLRRKLASFLNEKGLLDNVSGPPLAVSLVPVANSKGEVGDALPKDPGDSRGAVIMPIEQLTNRSEYYRHIAQEYNVKHCLLTNNDTVIGPDAGILTAACTAARIFDGRMRVIEFGTGVGTTLMALLCIDKLSSYAGNDFSPEIARFFETTIQPRLRSDGISSHFVHGECSALEPFTQADLIIVGIFYQAQPDLFRERGRSICEALSADGALIIQSGKAENRFITDLLTEYPTSDAAWPWYDNKFFIGKYIRYVAKADVHDETMVIASHDPVYVDRIIADLNSAGSLTGKA